MSEGVLNVSEKPARRSYKHPPILEAFCELQFVPNTDPWNPTTPGLLYDRLREDYPGTPRQQIAAGLQIQPQPDVPGISFRPPVVAVELLDDEERNFLTIAPNVLTVRVRAPYPGWEVFYAKIERAVGQYGEISPKAEVQRMGLRYVNRVVIPSLRVELTDYFNSAPTTPEGFPENLVGVGARFESDYGVEDHDIRMVYNFGNASEPDASAFVIDIDMIEAWTVGFPVLSKAVSLLPDLKAKENAAFEAIITDKSRELFNAD